MAIDHSEDIEKKHAEEALNRKAKAGIQSNIYNCSVKMAKFHIKKEPTIKQVTCQKCGKIFKTNRQTKLCFNCEKKK